MNTETIKIKKLDERAKLPTHGSEKSAGYDLHARISDGMITINPHETVKIGTGLSIELPNGTFGAIFARSGLATKSGLRPANCVGLIDSDYRGNVIVALYNDSSVNKTISPKERIAQLMIVPFEAVEFEVVVWCTSEYVAPSPDTKDFFSPPPP